jgi:hypothetical protein
MCALTVAPWAQRFGLYYELLDHNCHAADFECFLRTIHRRLGRPLLLIWDRLNAHRSAAKHLSEDGCSWVQPRWLPGYAPELDPVEFVWTQAKYGDLANWIPQDINEVRRQLTSLLEQYRHDPARLYSFFTNAQLLI